jgi:hypothetical protein
VGSTGTNKFTDYSGSKSTDVKGGATGGASGADPCDSAFTTDLEDVDRCSYYQTNNTLPSTGTQIYVTHNKRLEVVDATSNLSLGYLPTYYNY